jgi:hypothetical protein
MDSDESPVEIDTPWFDPTWLLDHPEFPLATSVVELNSEQEETK